MKKKVVVLGSSGSIGQNAVRVLSSLHEYFEVAGLAVRNSTDVIAAQARSFHCRKLVTADAESCRQLRNLLPENYQCQYGVQALVDLVTEPDVDIVLCAIVGTGGLLPVLAALQAGKRVALASKEVMVMAGDLVNSQLDSGHGSIIPVDSEHSAIFQCLNGRPASEVNKLILTASGGAFRDWPPEKLASATWQDAMQHPVWNMGSKVTVDSATLMNKALEIVEAGQLFRMSADKIDVLIHPQSLVHSMVELTDGSLLAQLSCPDMRFAIQYALTFPERLDGQLPRLDWQRAGQLDFQLPDRKKYPSLDLAFAALRTGGTLPAVMNAANEVAVQAFANGTVTLPVIWNCVEHTMSVHQVRSIDSLDTVLEADRTAREIAGEFIKEYQI